MEIDCVVKLGGSAITDKKGFELCKEGSLRSAADIIAELFCMRQMKVIVIHGAGSFGHPQAKHYQIKTGFQSLSDRDAMNMKLGFCVTKHSVQKLNRLVVDAMINRKIPAVSISPCSGWKTDSGTVVVDNLNHIAELIQLNFVPVVHGDCVLDGKNGCNILSGDTIIKAVATSDLFRVKRAVFLTDVRGVFTKQPSLEGATLIPEIYVDKCGCVRSDAAFDVSTNQHSRNSGNSSPSRQHNQQQQQAVDVTGSFSTKISSAVDMVHQSAAAAGSKGHAMPVYICQLESSVAKAVCLGEIAVADMGKFTTVRMKYDAVS